jgi:hypothetical protein
MKVKILKLDGNKMVDAEILSARKASAVLPSVTNGWRFDFKKHAKRKQVQTYVLVNETTPDIIEGCLIFEMKGNMEPYMAFVEAAPHNQGKEKEHDRVAGCLIAFACRLSFLMGNEVYGGWLTFDVMEELKEDEIKLMALYSKKYYALRYEETTTMVIPPTGGQKLIEEFLK